MGEYFNTSSRLHHERAASNSDHDGEQDILSLSHTSILSRDSSIGDWLPIEQRVEELKMKYRYTIEDITEYFENLSSEMTEKMLPLMPAELKAYLKVTKAESKDIFRDLVGISDYRQTELLHQLVSGLGDENCKRAVSLYQGDLNCFNSETTLGEFAENSHGALTSTGHEEIVLKMGAKWEKKTLQDFEELKKKLQHKASLGAHDLQMLKVGNASVEVTLVMVSALANIHNLKLVQPGFFAANNMLQVSIKDCIIYDVESPQVCTIKGRQLVCICHPVLPFERQKGK